MKTTSRILAYLKIHGPCTVAELASALDRTKAAIRVHTDHLCKENLIIKIPAGFNNQPGRPASRFCRAETIPDPLAKGLVSGLMQFVLKKQVSVENTITIENEIVDELISHFHPTGSTSASRMNQAIQFLETLGVMARWHASKFGPRIIVVQEGFSPLINHASISKRVTQTVVKRIKDKAVGHSPTA